MIEFTAKEFWEKYGADGIKASEEDVTITVTKGSEYRTYLMHGPKSGSIIVKGSGDGNACRYGSGKGNAWRYGPGKGDA